ncbi:MAG TPA: hypothetical protein VGK59_11240 [Ohtaekwangia sp.]
MKINARLALLFCCGLVCLILSCEKDDNDKPKCDTFSSADSICFCQQQAGNIRCSDVLNTSISISLVTEEVPELTPHPSNGTIWSKGFSIGNTIFVIDRESESPQAFWKFDLHNDGDWVAAAPFPGNRYGLTGAANGKGYASSSSSNEFWEYDPAINAWTSLDTLPFTATETHWVEYEGKFYVPDQDGVFEFDPVTKEWNTFSDQTSSGFGAIFIIGSDMYWWNINDEDMSHLDLEDKSYEKVPITDENFNTSVTFNSPFVIEGVAYIVGNTTLWIFDNQSQTWFSDGGIISSGQTYADDAFVIDGTAYVIDNGNLRIMEFSSGD